MIPFDYCHGVEAAGPGSSPCRRAKFPCGSGTDVIRLPQIEESRDTPSPPRVLSKKQVRRRERAFPLLPRFHHAEDRTGELPAPPVVPGEKRQEKKRPCPNKECREKARRLRRLASAPRSSAP